MSRIHLIALEPRTTQVNWIQVSQVAANDLIDKLGKEEAAEGAAQFAKLGVYGWAPGLTEFGPRVWSICDTSDSPEQPKVTKPADEHSGWVSGITPRASTESQAGDLQEVQMELNSYASHCHSAGWFTGPNPNMDDCTGGHGA